MASAVLAQGTRAAGPRAGLLGAIAVVGAVAITVSVALAPTRDHVTDRGIQAALLNWITFGYVSAGLIALWRRPAGRFGVLMIAAGFVMFLSTLSSANSGLPYTVGAAFDLLPAVLFLHVFLAFPDGRLEGRFERALVVTGYVVGFGVQLVTMLFGGFGPDNLLEVTVWPGGSEVLQRGELFVLSALLIAGIWVLVA